MNKWCWQTSINMLILMVILLLPRMVFAQILVQGYDSQLYQLGYGFSSGNGISGNNTVSQMPTPLATIPAAIRQTSGDPATAILQRVG